MMKRTVLPLHKCVIGHSQIDPQEKIFIQRHSFLPGLGWPWTPVTQQPRIVIRTRHPGWMHGLMCCSWGIPERWNTLRDKKSHTGAEGDRLW